MKDREKEGNNRGLPCHSEKIPAWLVLLDNLPSLALFVMGFLIINQLSLPGAIAYGIYVIFSIMWFWAKICPYCHHYGIQACPCGYGLISASLFKKMEDKPFRKVFKKHIIVQYPNWFVPFAVALYLLITEYSNRLLIMALLFSVTGFVIIPLISKLAGCRNCKVKDDCPWMMKKGK